MRNGLVADGVLGLSCCCVMLLSLFGSPGVAHSAEAAPAAQEAQEASPAPDLQGALGRAKAAIDRGAAWLRDHQNPDGGYGPFGEKYVRIKNASDLGITSFVVYALARCPRQYKYVDGPFISMAVDFLLECQQPSGAFYDPRDPSLPNYKTSVTGMALLELNRSKYADVILRSREFVEALQFSEANGYERAKHAYYGGFGYGSGLRADNSNSQFAAEFLYLSGLSQSDELWQRLEIFSRRGVNSPEVDPILAAEGIGSTGDGGGRYGPTITRGPTETLDDGRLGFSSYGSMSYAVLKTFLYAQVERDDPVMRGLYRWISRNFTVTENPGMATRKNPHAGRHGLYYYYHTMSKSLRIWGEPTVRDAEGRKRHWATELIAQLSTVQQPDGSWLNTSDRWYENIPALNTAYAIVTLSECSDAIKKELAFKAAAEE